MEQIINPQNMPTSISSEICSVCHQPLLASYYFCPNCGHPVSSKEAPLDTTLSTKVIMYTLSVFQPMFLFIFYRFWHGIKYYKSTDPKAHNIGQAACAILAISTILNIWSYYEIIVTIPKLTQYYQTYLTNSITTDTGL